jgi:hypothetical protein
LQLETGDGADGGGGAASSPSPTSSASSSPPLRSQASEVLLARFQAAPGGDCCADCGASAPSWASANTGALICIGCVGVHRMIGTSFSTPLSVMLDDWSGEGAAVARMLRGNTATNEELEACVPPGIKARLRGGGGGGGVEAAARQTLLEDFVWSKYARRCFVAGGAGELEALPRSAGRGRKPDWSGGGGKQEEAAGGCEEGGAAGVNQSPPPSVTAGLPRAALTSPAAPDRGPEADAAAAAAGARRVSAGILLVRVLRARGLRQCPLAPSSASSSGRQRAGSAARKGRAYVLCWVGGGAAAAAAAGGGAGLAPHPSQASAPGGGGALGGGGAAAAECAVSRLAPGGTGVAPSWGELLTLNIPAGRGAGMLGGAAALFVQCWHVARSAKAGSRRTADARRDDRVLGEGYGRWEGEGQGEGQGQGQQGEGGGEAHWPTAALASARQAGLRSMDDRQRARRAAQASRPRAVWLGGCCASCAASGDSSAKDQQVSQAAAARAVAARAKQPAAGLAASEAGGVGGGGGAEGAGEAAAAAAAGSLSLSSPAPPPPPLRLGVPLAALADGREHSVWVTLVDPAAPAEHCGAGEVYLSVSFKLLKS